MKPLTIIFNIRNWAILQFQFLNSSFFIHGRNIWSFGSVWIMYLLLMFNHPLNCRRWILCEFQSLPSYCTLACLYMIRQYNIFLFGFYLCWSVQFDHKMTHNFQLLKRIDAVVELVAYHIYNWNLEKMSSEIRNFRNQKSSRAFRRTFIETMKRRGKNKHWTGEKKRAQ